VVGLPLSRAARNGHYAVVELLLAKDGVSLNSKDKYGRTPLRWAAEKEYKAVVKRLLAEGVTNPDLDDNDSRTRFHCPQRTGTMQW
jgi:ankyrin repeat protein